MKHLDLFSGIGGFAYAVDQVWENTEHIFCDNDKFCQQVIKKHWPNSKIYGDIREIKSIANTPSERLRGRGEDKTKQQADMLGEDIKKDKRGIIANTRSEKQRRISGGKRKEISPFGEIHLLTGGFPCQPFSQAGKRKGTEDNRYLWPEMLRVIQLTKPQWIIAENVRGLLTQQRGLVFKQVCFDLESNGYEVQPFIIPAVAVNAPHRRDRVWIIAHAKSKRDGRITGKERRIQPGKLEPEKQRRSKARNKSKRCSGDITDSESRESGEQTEPERRKDFERRNWERNWLEIATELCGMDDGLPAKLDGFELSKSKHRVERLKSLGNAIVPQVAIEIMKAIKNWQ